MKLYLKGLNLHLRKTLEYKSSFIISLISQTFVFFGYYFIILALFQKFNNIKGYTLYEVLLCFSIIQFGFSFCELFFRGLDDFDKLIIRGDFDRLLLRPKNIILQILLDDIDYVKVTKIIQSIIILIISIVNLDIALTFDKVICLILMLISSVAVIFSLFLLCAAYCFMTIEGLEVRNAFTYGGRQMAQYPISVFKKGFRYFFTFIIPYGLVNYYPLLYFIGRKDNFLYALSPLLVFIYVIVSYLIFKLCLKKYTSTGS